MAENLSPSTSSSFPFIPVSESPPYQNPDAEGWVNPRRPLTAMTIPSGGLAGGMRLPRRCRTNRSCRRFIPRHPPVATTSTDPYWIRGGLQTADDISDDEADISINGDGLAGGGEVESAKRSDLEDGGDAEEGEEGGDAEEGEGGDAEEDGDAETPSEISPVQSIPISDPVMWAKAQTGADQWMEDMLRRGKLDGNIW